MVIPGRRICSPAHVVQTHGEFTIVLPRESCTDQACSGGCAQCGEKARGHAVRVKTSNADTFSVGQSVELCRFIPNAACAASLVFGVPLAAAAGWLIVWTRFFGDPETPAGIGGAAAAAAVGFAVAVFADMLIRRRYPPSLRPIGNHASTAQSG